MTRLQLKMRKFGVVLIIVAFLSSLLPAAVSAATEWQPNTAYTVGTQVTYQSSSYQCLQAHTSQVGWEPPNTPALWQKLSSSGDTQAPSAPANFRSTGVTSSSVSLAWNASTDNVGVTGYEVFIGSSTTAAATTTGATSVTVSGLTANTTYSFTVKARDAAGNRSAASAAVSAKTAASTDTQAPSVPGNFRSTGVTVNSVSLAWNASTDNVGVTGYEVFIGGSATAAATTTGATAVTVGGLAANTTYSFTVKARDAAGNRSAASAAVSAKTSTTPPPTGGKLLVGYWHNFDNGSTNIRLRNVSSNWDVIQVAFADSTGGAASGNMVFTPYNATVAEFQSDVAYLKSQGKKVLISVGGQNGAVDLSAAAAKTNFVNSMVNIIQTYGFNGMDIDLEGGSISLNGGDTDYKNPTTPKIVNMIAATRDIKNRIGSGFMLTMAPETAYVQGGNIAYGGPWGAYLPVIYGLRDILTFIHVQHYNSGSMNGLDGRSYTQGTADFHVAMAEMLLRGFPISNNTANMFPALQESQVLIGLPASSQAAGGGYTPNAEVQKAVNYIVKGQSFGGSYVLRKPAGYPGFKGIMAWSINWDAATGFSFSNSHRAFLNTL